MNDNTDQFIIEKVLSGNVQAFGELVDRYQNFVFTTCIRILKNREEAEEVAQDSFIKVFNSLKTFRGDSKFSTWLYRIAYHKSLDKLKQFNKNQDLPLIEEVTEDILERIENGLDFLVREERSEIIEKCISKLAETDAAIIGYYYFEDLSVKEIADIIDLTEDNVKIKLYRSRKQLFSLLNNYINPEISKKNGTAI